MKIFFFIISLLLGLSLSLYTSLLLYQFYFNVGNLFAVVLAPAALIFFVVLIIITVFSSIKRWEYPTVGFAVFVGMTFMLTSLSIINKILKDSPRVVLKATFYNESGFDLFLRENMTVKCTEKDILSTMDRYGKYELRGDTIILSNIDITYGLSEVTDTMIIKDDHLIFRLDKEWRRILEGQMYIEKNTLK